MKKQKGYKVKYSEEFKVWDVIYTPDNSVCRSYKTEEKAQEYCEGWAKWSELEDKCRKAISCPRMNEHSEFDVGSYLLDIPHKKYLELVARLNSDETKELHRELGECWYKIKR